MVSNPSVTRLNSKNKSSRIKNSYRCAKLNEELADRLAVVHCVKGCDFVDAHRRHLQDAGNLVHHADTSKSVLALA